MVAEIRRSRGEVAVSAWLQRKRRESVRTLSIAAARTGLLETIPGGFGSVLSPYGGQSYGGYRSTVSFWQESSDGGWASASILDLGTECLDQAPNEVKVSLADPKSWVLRSLC